MLNGFVTKLFYSELNPTKIMKTSKFVGLSSHEVPNILTMNSQQQKRIKVNEEEEEIDMKFPILLELPLLKRHAGCTT